LRVKKNIAPSSYFTDRLKGAGGGPPSASVANIGVGKVVVVLRVEIAMFGDAA
jgi:hypothetical protein